MKQIIQVKLKAGTRPILAEKYKVSVTTVSMAASGYNNSETAQAIRIAAVKLGGKPIYDNN